MDDDLARRLRVQRAVADKVTDAMLSTPVGELTDAEVAILQAALVGAYGPELVERMDKLNAERNR